MLRWLRRNWLRLISAAFFALLALGVIPAFWRIGHSLLPHFSPLLNLGGALAARKLIGWSLLLGAPILLLAIFRGRWFCWHLCPMGALADLAGQANPRGRGLVKHIPALNQGLAVVIALTCAFGYPFLIWLDPLCIFNGFFTMWRKPLTWAASATGIGFAAIIIASVIAPGIWCFRLCPLGGLQEFLMRAVAWLRAPKGRAAAGASTLTAAQVSRRGFIAVAASGVAAFSGRKAFGARAAAADVIRPPGAVPHDRFSALCARCGNCMKACPYHLISPDFGASGIDGLLTPVLLLRSRDPKQEQFCFQDCVECSRVCPTGALQKLTVEQKHARPIGLAVVDRNKCIAWAKREYCVVCDEYCPYKAIKIEKHGGVNCPVVDSGKCRGCGACESNCPAEPIAITVHARPSALDSQGRDVDGGGTRERRRMRLRGANSPDEKR